MITSISVSITYETESSKSVKIISPISNQTFSRIGNITVGGNSSDSPLTDCNVNLTYISANGQRVIPVQPLGVGGLYDYSQWRILFLLPF